MTASNSGPRSNGAAAAEVAELNAASMTTRRLSRVRCEAASATRIDPMITDANIAPQRRNCLDFMLHHHRRGCRYRKDSSTFSALDPEKLVDSRPVWS